MLDGRILLGEAVAEFEKIYIERAIERYGTHVSRTAAALGIHRNTLSKRISISDGNNKRSVKPTSKPAARKPRRIAKPTGKAPRIRKKAGR